MDDAVDGQLVLNPGYDSRKEQRKREFSAAVVFDLDDARSVDCLIRDASAGGAQLRIGRDYSIAPGSYLVHLKNRIAFELHPVWRRPFLIGVKYDNSHPIDNSLPQHLNFLKQLLVEARLHHANCIASHGVCTRDLQHQLAMSYAFQ